MKWMLLIAVAALGSTAGHPQSLPPQQLSVMLSFKDKAGADLDECAAGIVIAQQPARTLILTAYHVLGLAPGEASKNGSQIYVEFPQLRGKRYLARILEGPGFQDTALDYLVIAVDGAPEVPRAAFSILARDGAQTSAVRTVGQGDCRPWDPDPVFHPVTSVGKFEIVFESAVSGGASGGALFDQGNALVAMVDDSDGRRASARPITLILDRLRQSGIAHELRLLPGTSDAVFRNPDLPASPNSGSEPGPVIDPGSFTASLESVSNTETLFVLRPPESLRGKIRDYESALEGFRRQMGVNADDYLFPFPNGTPPKLSASIRILFNNGQKSEPFVVPVKALYEAEMRKAFARLDWIKCERGPLIYCRTYGIQTLLPLIQRIRLGPSPTEQPLALSCRTKCDIGAGPPYLVQSADFAASYARIFAEVELVDGTIYKAIELPIEDKSLCREIECPPGSLAAKSIGTNQPPAILRATNAFGSDRFYSIDLPDSFPRLSMEIDSDGKGFLPAETGAVSWGAAEVSVRFRTKSGIIGPFRYHIPEAELIRISLPRPPEIGLFNCLHGSCGMQDPMWVASIKTLELGSAPDRLVKRSIPDLRIKILDLDFRMELLKCRSLMAEGCDKFREGLGVDFKPAPGQMDIYYRFETYGGAKTDVVRQQLR